jgi:membrane protein DedA with SNARE-associated domain
LKDTLANHGALAFLNEWIAPVLSFIQAHEAWAAPIAFLLAFLKSLAFVSLIIPGTALLLAIGGLIGASGIAFLPIWIAISIGAALGDWVSYWLGRRYEATMRRSRFALRHPALMGRAEAFFRQWGWLGIVGCRFFGPLRATVPLVAGLSAMPPLAFHLSNWASAFLWAGALLLPGATTAKMLSP